jgi:hypothetical protein
MGRGRVILVGNRLTGQPVIVALIQPYIMPCPCKFIRAVGNTRWLIPPCPAV